MDISEGKEKRGEGGIEMRIFDDPWFAQLDISGGEGTAVWKRYCLIRDKSQKLQIIVGSWHRGWRKSLGGPNVAIFNMLAYTPFFNAF